MYFILFLLYFICFSLFIFFHCFDSCFPPQVTGFDAPKPVTSFGHFGFDEALMKSIRKSEYTQPTPIQSQAVPIALSGRDAIGIAKTGSGKTAAFIWPMLVHIMDQRELAPGDGPIGLILAPTRELAQQIYTEARRFGKVYNIQVSQVVEVIIIYTIVHDSCTLFQSISQPSYMIH